MNPFRRKQSRIIYTEKAEKPAFQQAAAGLVIDFGRISSAVADLAKKCLAQDAEGSLHSLADALGTPPGVVLSNIKLMEPLSEFRVKYRQVDNDVLIRFFRKS